MTRHDSGLADDDEIVTTKDAVDLEGILGDSSCKETFVGEVEAAGGMESERSHPVSSDDERSEVQEELEVADEEDLEPKFLQLKNDDAGKDSEHRLDEDVTEHPDYPNVFLTQGDTLKTDQDQLDDSTGDDHLRAKEDSDHISNEDATEHQENTKILLEQAGDILLAIQNGLVEEDSGHSEQEDKKHDVDEEVTEHPEHLSALLTQAGDILAAVNDQLVGEESDLTVEKDEKGITEDVFEHPTEILADAENILNEKHDPSDLKEEIMSPVEGNDVPETDEVEVDIATSESDSSEDDDKLEEKKSESSAVLDAGESPILQAKEDDLTEDIPENSTVVEEDTLPLGIDSSEIQSKDDDEHEDPPNTSEVERKDEEGLAEAENSLEKEDPQIEAKNQGILDTTPNKEDKDSHPDVVENPVDSEDNSKKKKRKKSKSSGSSSSDSPGK